MDYREFVNALLEEVRIMTGDGVTVRLHEIPKNNGIVREGITIMKEGCNLAPTIAVDGYYEMYSRGIGIGVLARKVIEENESISVSRCVPEDEFLDFGRLKDRILYRYINFDRNAVMLREMPFFRHLDLAMVFYYHVHAELPSDSTVLIRNQDLRRWGITPQELRELAVRNTPEKEPAEIMPIRDIISEMGERKAEGRETEAFPEQEEMPMYVLTNRDRTYGAACLSYKDVFRSLSEHFGTGLYILPSSIHEVILLPDSGNFSKEELEKMVTEINECEVAPYEVLSNHVYRYDREINEIVM